MIIDVKVIGLLFMFAAARGPAVAPVPALRARVRALAAAAVAALAPRDAPCHVPDHALHPKILRSPIKIPIT